MRDQKYVSDKTAFLIESAVTDKAINMPSSLRDNIRASILKSMITAIMAWNSKKV